MSIKRKLKNCLKTIKKLITGCISTSEDILDEAVDIIDEITTGTTVGGNSRDVQNEISNFFDDIKHETNEAINVLGEIIDN